MCLPPSFDFQQSPSFFGALWTKTLSLANSSPTRYFLWFLLSGNILLVCVFAAGGLRRRRRRGYGQHQDQSVGTDDAPSARERAPSVLAAPEPSVFTSAPSVALDRSRRFLTALSRLPRRHRLSEKDEEIQMEELPVAADSVLHRSKTSPPRPAKQGLDQACSSRAPASAKDNEGFFNVPLTAD